MTHEWRDLPALRGRFHPDYPDDVQVLVHDGGPRFTDRRPELVWVRIVMAAPGAFTAVVLNQPEQLTSVRQGDRIQFVVPKSGEHPVMVRDKYLAERAAWIVHPCRNCGLTELFDAPSDLIQKTLKVYPGETMEAFTAFCGACHGVQMVEAAFGEDSPSVPADDVPRLPIRGRLLAMGVLAAIGGVAFLPFLAAGNGESISSLTSFAIVVTLVATIAAWPGLRCADATGLPMPLLRRLDGSSVNPIPRSAIGVTLASSIGLGVIGLLLLRLVEAPPLPGSIAARALSAIFAAGPLEIVLHLGAMSIVVQLAHGRRAPGIAFAAALLVVFHLAGGGLDQPGRLIALIVAANGAIGLVLGWIYAVYGFEFVMLGHAVAHVITVVGG